MDPPAGHLDLQTKASKDTKGSASNNSRDASQHSTTTYRDPEESAETTLDTALQSLEASNEASRAVHEPAADGAKHLIFKPSAERSQRKSISCSPSSRLVQRSSRLSFGGAVLLSLLVLSATVVFAFRQLRYMMHADEGEPCGTDDCLLHAKYLKGRLNATSDPCLSLYAYVCGSPSSAGSSNAIVEDEVMRLYSDDLKRDAQGAVATEKGHSLSSSGGRGDDFMAPHKESNAFRLCLDRSSKQPEPLREFMKERGIPWPEKPDAGDLVVTTTEVLDVLLDLTLNWKVSLWFDLSVTSADPKSVRLQFQEPGPLVLLRRRQLREMEEKKGDYAKLVRDVAAFLSEGDSSVLTDADVGLLHEDDVALRSKLDRLNDEDGEDELFTLKKMQTSAINVTVPSLLALLRKHLSSSYSLTLSSTVLIFDNNLLYVVFLFLSQLPARRIFDLVGWTFAYTYVWIVNPDFEQFSFAPSADGHKTEAGTRSLCFLAVHESFGLLRIMYNFGARFDSNDTAKASEVVQGVIQALVEQVRRSRIISDVSKETAVRKIDMSNDSGLPEGFTDIANLDSLCEKLPYNYSSFYEAWLSTRDSKLRAVPANLVLSGRYRWRTEKVHYLHSTNTLLTRIAAFYPTLYFPHGSVSMSYAGLGFQVSENIAKAITGRGRAIDDTGAKRFWWSAQDTCLWDHAKSSQEKEAIRWRFALRLATEAMGNHAVDPFVKLKSLEYMSGKQTFYASFCSHFCDEPDGEVVCNAAMLEEGFKSAFHCGSWWSRFAKRESECLVL
ncbi:hypothetical protein V5799_000285 [Amblyomma americanum]|uniref:Peptidase M13 N-terminal domain-containing protein n=1 Tax=Amblyomma americanum TaxID=6943 RepID=A0AAQ4D3H5_AMBAM